MHTFTVNMYTDQAIVIKMISIEYIYTLTPPTPFPLMHCKKLSPCVLHTYHHFQRCYTCNWFFLYVLAICSSFNNTNFGQIHSSVLKSSCFTYWYLSQFSEMLHMFYTLVWVPCGFVAMFTC